jgi:hypothetical protein
VSGFACITGGATSGFPMPAFPELGINDGKQ